MTKEERIWWMVLLEADIQSEIHCHREDGESGFRAAQVGNQARKILVNKFGLNLDDLAEEARAIYLRLYEERVKADETEKQRTDHEALVAWVQDLLKD